MSKPLYIIPGHGHGDPGAGGHGYSEATQVRKLAAEVKRLGGADVTVHDTSRNAYAQGDLNTINVPKGTMVLELHMDSGQASAKGAHVIIKSGFNADSFDNALAKALSSIFPGRSNIIVGRSDLANANRAAKRGINYRLAECGFISNEHDAKYFDSHLTEVATAILKAAGIKVKGAASAPAPSTPATPAPSTGGLSVDGWWGWGTTKALQAHLRCVADGEVWGQWSGNRRWLPNCAGGWRFSADPSGSPCIKALQGRLGATADGIAGRDTVSALQRRLGVYPDGVCGPKTVRALQAALNDGRL